MNKEVVIPAAYALGGLVIGGTSTYFAVKSRLKAKYEAISNEEIASIKKHYNEQLDEGIEKAKETYAFVKGTPEEAARIYMSRMDEVRAQVDYSEQVKTLGYGESTLADDIVTAPIDDAEELMVVDDVNPVIPSNRLASDEELAALREKLRRGPDIIETTMVENAQEELKNDLDNPPAPYVIPVEEFFQDKEDYAKLTITYFEKDDTLVDERNSPIPDVDGTVGARFHEQFGYKSSDANIVYIRNNRLEADFEVVLDKSSFTETILGIPDEEPRKTPIKRMREDG